MILQIRTKDELESLLRHRLSPAWRISEWRIPHIEKVEIYQFDGKRVIKADFDAANSKRDGDRLIVAFQNGKIEDAAMKWVGQNSIKYVNISALVDDKSGSNINLVDDSQSKVNVEIEILSTEEYDISYGRFDMNILVSTRLLNTLNEKVNYDSLVKIVNNITNDESAILKSADKQIKLIDLKEAEYDWFNLCPRIVINFIDNIDLRPIHKVYMQRDEDYYESAAEILDVNISDIEDYVGDFSGDTIHSINPDLFKKIFKLNN